MWKNLLNNKQEEMACDYGNGLFNSLLQCRKTKRKIAAANTP